MIKIELKPAIDEGSIRAMIKTITGVEPHITICCNSRVALTIDAELTIDKRQRIEQEFKKLQRSNWQISLSETED